MADFSLTDILNQTEFQPLSSLFYEKVVMSGEVLYDFDEPAQTLYYLEKGRLSVQKHTGFEEKMQVIALLDSGTIVSEASLLKGYCHQTRVVAVDQCQLLCLDREKYTQLRKDSAETAALFLEYILRIVSLRLEKTSERLAHIL
jgi:CRP-like cAMP-binding protein